MNGHSKDTNDLWSFPTVNKKGAIPTQAIVVRDITLREGEQTSDVAFTSSDKIAIGMKLSEAGVHQIQCGYSPEDCNIVAELKKQGCKSRLEIMCVGYSKNWKEQVERAVASGADIVHFIFRSDDQHLAELGVDRNQAIERVKEIVHTIKSAGAKEMSFGPSFASRAEPNFLIKFINAASLEGVNQVVVSDSTGSMNPEGYGTLISYIRANTQCRLAVHCHNDFGLALANAIAGVRAGAQIVECSLGGLGERAGNTATEELVFSLKYLYEADLGIDLKKIVEAANTALSLSKTEAAPLKPILGSNAFTQKLDIHVMTTKTKPWLHEPFDPESIGMRHKLVVGKRSGPIAVREKARLLSIELDESKVNAIVDKVNLFSDEHKRSLTDEEFIKIVRASE